MQTESRQPIRQRARGRKVLKRLSRLACTRYFCTKRTPSEIHDMLRTANIESMPFVYIPTDVSTDKLTLSPQRMESGLWANSFAGELGLRITPTDSGSEVELALMKQPYVTWFNRIAIGFCVLMGLSFAVQNLPLFIPGPMTLLIICFSAAGYRFVLWGLERQI